MMAGIKGWRIMMMFNWAGWVNREQLKDFDYLKGETGRYASRSYG